MPTTTAHHQEVTTMPNPTCPQCGRPCVGRAFATTALYGRCSLGHVFAAAPTAEEVGR